MAISGALVAGLAGPLAYSVQTAATSHAGALPTAGPAVAGARGGPGGGPAGGRGFGPGAQPGGQPGGGQPSGGVGGLLNGSTPSTELTTLLQPDADSYTWVLATIGANQASGYQLASGDPVMAIGGFNGTDPTPTLAAFQAYVAAARSTTS